MAKKKAATPKYENVIEGKIDVIKQYLRDKDYAVKARQVKINGWIKIEEAYNGVVQKTLLTRSNLHAPVVFAGVQKMKTKLGGMPDFKYNTSPEEDENAAEIMHHVVKQDLDECDFEDVYEDSKVEVGIYGRTIYEVIPGNDRNRVELVDTLAYLISPIGTKTRTALYQGRQFIYKTIEQIEEEAVRMGYDMEEVAKLRENKIPNEVQSDGSSEAALKNIRNASMGLTNVTNYGSKVAELTNWWTYCEGKLYALTVANDVYLLRKVLASSLGLRRPPFVSWGTYTRGVAFWCPAVGGIYLEPGMAVDVSLNQTIDNNTYRNFGMHFVSSRSGLKQSSINPRPLGLTTVEVGPKEKIQDHIYTPDVPQITDAMATMNVVRGLADDASGIIPSQQTTKGKMSVTRQAQLNAEVEDSVRVMRRNATKAFRELVQLMADITKDKLTKPRTVKIFGYKNLDIENVTKKNFRGVKLLARATPAEDSQQNKAIKQKAKVEMYELFKDDPKIPGQIALRRTVAKTFDLPAEEMEAIFTPDKDPQQEKAAPVMAPGQPAAPGAETPAPTEATPLLSQAGAAAQAQVPPMIK